MGIAPSCSKRIEGSGFVISPQHVITKRRTVVGRSQETAPQSPLPPAASSTPRWCCMTRQRDIAVLDVPGLPAAGAAASVPRPATGQGRPSWPATRWTRRSPRVPARIDVAEQAVGPKHLPGPRRSSARSNPIRAVVKPGNSGGPLLAPNGRVLRGGLRGGHLAQPANRLRAGRRTKGGRPTRPGGEQGNSARLHRRLPGLAQPQPQAFWRQPGQAPPPRPGRPVRWPP